MVIRNSMNAAHLEESIEKRLLLGGRLCLNFCNTAEYRGTTGYFDSLLNYRILVRWSGHAGAISQEEAEQLRNVVRPAAADFAFTHAVELRDVIYTIFAACAEKQPIHADALAALNAALLEATSHREIVLEQNKPVWAWRDNEHPERPLWAIALSAAELLTVGSEDNLDRVRQCPGCGWLFVDESRNHSRTWCDMRFCGNRAKAQRHYERQKHLKAVKNGKTES
jgi:predicted RNA-binding Zn ribbon-like protein